jgi:hypothetical protein
MREDEAGETRSALGQGIRATVFRIIQKERVHMEYLSIDGRIILE